MVLVADVVGLVIARVSAMTMSLQKFWIFRLRWWRYLVFHVVAGLVVLELLLDRRSVWANVLGN